MEITQHEDPNEISISFPSEINERFYDAVLIIGNGFDRAFSLETNYESFVEHSLFKELLSKGNNLAQYLYKKKKLKKWIDIENELAIFSRSELPNTLTFYNEFKELSNQLMKYLESLNINEKIDESNIAFQLIKKVNRFKTLIIDFNYTSTVDKILKKLNERDNKLIRHLKIHGSLINQDIIFGVDDKAKIRDEHIFLKKSVSQNYKTENFNAILAECNSIGIFGHSLGETDHMYFSDFFRHYTMDKNKYSNKDIAIYYFGEESRLELHMQLDKLTNKSIAKFKRNNRVKFINTQK